MNLKDIHEILQPVSGIIFAVLTMIQISPIKIDPWSWLFKCIGNALNGDIRKEIIHINDTITKIKDENDERDATNSRIRILRFNDELLNRVDHTKEYFDQILTDIDKYENYCIIHPDFKNNMTVFAVENIKKCYRECLEEHKFL